MRSAEANSQPAIMGTAGGMSIAVPRPRSVTRNASWALAGSIVYNACMWGNLVFLSKAGTPELVGKLVLAMAVCVPVFEFCNLALRPVMATDARGDFELPEYLGLRVITALLAMAIVAGAAALRFFPWDAALVVLAYGVAKVFDVFSDVFYGFFQRHEHLNYFAESAILRGLLSFLCMAGLFVATGSLPVAILGFAASWALVLFLHDVPRARSLLEVLRHEAAGGPQGSTLAGSGVVPRFHLPVLKRLVVLSLPLGMAVALISLNASIPRYFVARYCGEAALGIFGAIAFVTTVGCLVTEAIGSSASPRLARHYAAGEVGDFVRLQVWLALAGAALGIGGVAVVAVLGRQILTLAYRPEYAENSGVFLGLMVVAAIWHATVFLGFGMTAARRFRVQPVMFGFLALVNAGLCWALVPTRGMMGAVVAMGAVAVLQTVIMFAVNLHAVRALQHAAGPAGGAP